MQPDQTPPSSQSPLDYLNQIAVQPTRRPRFRDYGIKAWVALGVVIIILVIIASVVVSNIAKSGSATIETLSVRLKETATIVTARQADIQDTTLANTNSSLSINLTQLNNDLDAVLTTSGKDPKKLDKSIVTKEKADSTAVDATLDDAKLNALFDSAYASTMAYRLETLLTMVHQLERGNVGPKTKAFLSEAQTDLNQAQTSFAGYNQSDALQ